MLYVWCPGCESAHGVAVVGEDGQVPPMCWDWNGATDETFTISPSLLTWRDDLTPRRQCHSFIQNGQWQFLPDSTHELAGQTVPMVPVPDWLTGR
jgi:hypothetical protein